MHKSQSLASSDCESSIIRQLFGQKQFQLGRTKASAIVSNVFAPKIVEEMRSELASCNFVAIGTDASNHVAIKMFPVIARWFEPLNGIKTKVLDLSDETGLLSK